MLYCKKLNLADKNDSLTLLYDMAKAGSLVLDVGCACGDLARALRENKNCRVWGLEYNAESVEICRQSGIFENVARQDLNNLTANSFPDYVGRFDYVICGDVLEHLLKPEDVLQILRSYLKPGGELLVSLPNAAHGSVKANLLLNDFTYTPIGILDRTHLHFYTWRSMASFLVDNGLAVTEAFAVTMPLDGWQPHALSELPKEISAFIAADGHSYIMQYVMRCRPQKQADVSANMRILNALALDKSSKANIIFRIKRLVVTKLPFILQHLETWRARRREKTFEKTCNHSALLQRRGNSAAHDKENARAAGKSD